MLQPEQEQQLKQLLSVFLEENQKLNLTALRDEESCWIGNILDSLAILDVEGIFKMQDAKYKILDIGTGGGFPLLPMALSLPEATYTGLDSTQKKIDAIQRIAHVLQIKNVDLVCGRTEDLGHDATHRQQYDLVTARAVAQLNTLLEWCAPFVRVGGHIVAWKSMHIDQELEDSLRVRAELSCHLVKTHVYALPGGAGKRQLLVFEKTNATSDDFPRDVGVAKKTPIV